jgi:hypothetical protein
MRTGSEAERQDLRPTPQDLRPEGPAGAVWESLSCEMCGAPVVASHCKRVCLKCGFMTGCSEGI